MNWDVIQKDDKQVVIVQSDKPLQLYNENHVLSAAGLAEVTEEDVGSLIQTKVQKYLVEKLTVKDQNDSTLYCYE